jgi:tetratricopeptide (TPR) repeat protein
MINFWCVRLILALCVSLTCLPFVQPPASATPALELKTFIGCVSGEQVFGTWKSPGNTDQKALRHGTVSAIRIITNNNPMNMSKLAGKLVKVTGRFDGKHSAIRFASNISIIGNCPEVSFTGCVVDTTLLVTKTTLGPITIAPESWEQIYAAEVKYDKKIIDIARFEGKLVRIIATGMQGGNRVESVTASTASDIETVGDCDLKTGLLVVRASQWYEDKADWYTQKKDWQRALSYIDKSITLTPNNCWGYKKRRDIYLALGNVENAEKDLQHLTGTRCAPSTGIDHQP